MSTILEIQKPYLTYCKEYDIHCPCPKCENLNCWQLDFKNDFKNYCKQCPGPEIGPEIGPEVSKNNIFIINNCQYTKKRKYNAYNN